MGNTQQSQTLVDNSYSFLSTKNNENYGEVKVYRKRNANDLVGVVSRSVGNQLNQMYEMVQRRQQIIKKMQTSNDKQVVADDLCSHINIIQILLEYLPSTLAEEFKSRLDQKLYFQEREIWYVILGLADVLSMLSQNNEDIHDIHPSRVLLNERKEIKIMGKQLASEGLPNYMQVQMGVRQFEYLAPEQLENYQSSALQQLSWEPINVFNIGLLALQMCSMQSVQDYYIAYSQELDEAFMKERLDKAVVKYKYSSKLHDVMSKMLAIHPVDRLSYKEILRLNIPVDQVASGLFAQLVSPRVTMPLQESRAGDSRVLFQSPEKASSHQSRIENSFIEDEYLNQRIQQAIENSKMALQEPKSPSSPAAMSNYSSLDIFPVTSKAVKPQLPYDDKRIMEIMRNAEAEIQKSHNVSYY